MVSVRPATAADIAAYYGRPQRQTMRAVAIVKEGVMVGIIGLARLPGRLILFSESKPELGEDIRSFAVRRATIEMAKLGVRSKSPLYAVKERGSDVLERLGFEQVSEDLYRWPSSRLSPHTQQQQAQP